MQLIHYYVQRGFDWEKLCNLSASEKLFLQASMDIEIESEVEKYKALVGES